MIKETAESKSERFKQQRAHRCKHFTGTMNLVCLKQHTYTQVVGHENLGWGRELPCILTDLSATQRATCADYEPLGEADNEAKEAEFTRRFSLVIGICQRIKGEHKGEDWQGVIECPNCKGDLAVRHAKYNGHVHGMCATENCLSWME